MLQPKKTKYRKQQKGKMKGNAKRGHQLAFGSFGIKTLEEAWITGRQIESARQAITRHMKREGQLWIRIFPDKPVTKNLLKSVWVKEKEHRNILLPGSLPAEFYFEIEGVSFELQRKHCAWVHRNCRWQPKWLHARIILKKLFNI
jgi:large subunit ribosomal protein L16